MVSASGLRNRVERERSIRASHIARQRGDGDALDGHALLIRCKVSALLVIMHLRVEVTEWGLASIRCRHGCFG